MNAFFDKKYPQVLPEIVKSGKIDDSVAATVKSALKEFETVFTA
jgi:hypothetical protein